MKERRNHFTSLLLLGSPQNVTQFGSGYQKLKFLTLKRQEIKSRGESDAVVYPRAEELRFEDTIDSRYSALF